MSLHLHISGCGNVAKAFGDDISCPCSKIVRSQGSHNINDFQIPEPWSGHLTFAPILFLSSNPSFDRNEHIFPRWGASSESVIRFFDGRFDDFGSDSSTRDGTRALIGGQYMAVPFWCAIKSRAKEIFQREVVAGVDYAFSEIVHCKSKKEIGVAEATKECVRRYLRPLIAASGAKLIVVLGKKAKGSFLGTFSGDPKRLIWCESMIEGRGRMVGFLPHPNARQNRRCASCWSAEELEYIRAFVRP